MTRRKTKNITGISRIEGFPVHDAYVAFICINCKELDTIYIGNKLIDPKEAYENALWKCEKCNFIHSKNTDIPFANWKKNFRKANSLQAQRFWRSFFLTSTENPDAFWKRCGACDRILPFHSFSKHIGWGPLERQMECRACKGAINAELNPKRTKQQLHESSVRRRIADILLADENEKIDFNDLFKRFGSKCFKTKKPLDINKRKTWTIDHILPSKYLYPLSVSNAALLSKEANDNKRDRLPSKFYTNNELIELAKITGADLTLLTSEQPIINPNIDVNKCVTRFLTVRERSDLIKRIYELKKMLVSYDLVDKLSEENKKLLGIKE
ncbi:MAG: hypothetical protein A2V66_15860 [Ignavibacteria bacterium RBG_13_36_8]|nr:MAG: hypothetical protein A2V66_15860 [Ignavibacteria bacterium RBG_13_36_8]